MARKKKTSTVDTGVKPDQKKAADTPQSEVASAQPARKSAKKPPAGQIVPVAGRKPGNDKKAASTGKRTAGGLSGGRSAGLKGAGQVSDDGRRDAAVDLPESEDHAVASTNNKRHAPRKTWLSEKDLVFFEQLLLKKRAELLGDMEGMSKEALSQNRSESSGDVSTMPTHMADLGSDNWEQEFTLGLIATERTLLREINEALERIKDRTYGICLATNERISKARLQAKPWAKYCIEYARKRELGLAP